MLVMRILAIGDFHGKFPKKLGRVIKKNKIDLVISNGDYFPFSYRELWFKHCYGKNLELWEAIGKKRFKELFLKDLKEAEYAIQKLNKVPVPVVTVSGNVDPSKYDDAIDRKRIKWGWTKKDFFGRIINKYNNIKYIDYSFTRFKDFIIIGGGPSSFPGIIKSKAYRRLRKRLNELFKKFKKENKEKKVIFISHNVPYDTKLDRITWKRAHKEVIGKHFGSKLVKRIIDKYRPFLFIGGHIHEGRGVEKLGRTLCVNPGSVYEGKYAIIEVDDGKSKRAKVRFWK